MNDEFLDFVEDIIDAMNKSETLITLKGPSFHSGKRKKSLIANAPSGFGGNYIFQQYFIMRPFSFHL
jgi:hypothetical protein